MNLTSYHDSVPAPARELPALDRHAKTQECDCLRWFQSHPLRSFSREEVEAALSYPTQTASRVLANLTARFAIEKTGERVRSSFGRTANKWRLVRPKVPVQEKLL